MSNLSCSDLMAVACRIEQAREAVAMTQRLADEQANVSLFAFGVGRGVDKVCPGLVT